MSLDELNKHLQSMDDSEDIHRQHDVDEYNPFGQANTEGENPFLKEREWKEPQKGLTSKQKKILKIIGIIVSVLIVVGLGWWGWEKWKKDSFHEDRVVVSIDGPKDADSTQTVEYFIKYENNNRITLRDVEVVLTYAENFQPIDNVNLKYLSKSSSKVYVGDIKPGAKAEVPFKGIFYAPKDYQVYLRASMDYSVSGRSEKLHSSGQLGVNIDNSPLLLDVVAPREAADGDSVEYVIDYKNLDVRSLEDVQLRAEFPQGFQLVSSNPNTSEGDNVWYMGTLEANQGGKVRIQGKLSGSPDDGKTFKLSLGKMGDDGNFVVYNQRVVNTRMVVAALSIKQSLVNGAENGITKAGANLSYRINYENNSNIGMRNAIVTVEIDSKIVDYSKLSIDRGSFDESKKTISWKASDVPELINIQPKGKGELKFTVPVLEIIPVTGVQDKNFTVRTVAKIDSPDIPSVASENKIIGSSAMELKLGSKVIIETLGYYEDANVENSGPMPLEVGKETTYTMHWTIFNVSNELQDAVLTASIPSGYRWTGKTYPENEHVEFDSRTNIISWRVGGVNPGVGLLEPKREVSFQIGITPQSNQSGRSLTLLNPGTFKAKDGFTKEEINLQIPMKDMQLHEDVSIPPDGYKVK